ncbi:hypothetical protein FM106_26865 [Brachybacterium faecium]|nr:hypothetical protein FM106_26865 [Brachybacterium faecium]
MAELLGILTPTGIGDRVADEEQCAWGARGRRSHGGIVPDMAEGPDGVSTIRAFLS